MKSDEVIKKMTTGKARFWSRVLVVAIIFSITAFFIFRDALKEYKGEVSILVKPKNSTISSQTESVVANIAELPKTLSFYERLVKFNPATGADFSGKSEAEKKSLWNESIEVSVAGEGKSSIINLGVFSNSPQGAKYLIEKTSRNLLEVSSGIYDVKNDVEMSIIDGPIVSAAYNKKNETLFYALLAGFFGSLVLNGSLVFLEKIVEPRSIRRIAFPKFDFEKKIKKEKEVEKKEEDLAENEYFYDVPYDFENLERDEFAAEKTNAAQQIEEYPEYVFKDNPYPNYPEMPKEPVRQASAPENLPIMDEIDIPLRAQEKNIKDEPTFVEMKKEEPTAEELRERLNRLLRGEM